MLETRKDLRDHRKGILDLFHQYYKKVKKLLKVKQRCPKIKIFDITRTTRVLIPRAIVPDEFIQTIQQQNEHKPFTYHIRVCPNRPEYVEVSLPEKPLITEGSGIIHYFFRELIQYAEGVKRARKHQK